MDNKEMGDVVFALKYCFEFYGKTLDRSEEHTSELQSR